MLELESLKSQLTGPVLITGHTGFKGTWLTLLLEELGIATVGVSLPPLDNSLFVRANRVGKIRERFIDINEIESLKEVVDDFQPSCIIHLAAQSLVSTSYMNPLETFTTNVLGTANLLEIATSSNFVRTFACITTDKVYENRNTKTRFVETDCLRGIDPYSASKVGTESVVYAWKNLAKMRNKIRILVFRAGNVIGGGDFAKDRLLPDIARHLYLKEKFELRNLSATRPWQHVLDPLLGYLKGIQYALEKNNYEHDTFNFGPKEDSLSVRDVLGVVQKVVPTFDYSENQSEPFYEALSLQLDSSLAEKILSWVPKYTQEAAIESTLNWWESNLLSGISAEELCKDEIRRYLAK